MGNLQRLTISGSASKDLFRIRYVSNLRHSSRASVHVAMSGVESRSYTFSMALTNLLGNAKTEEEEEEVRCF